MILNRIETFKTSIYSPKHTKNSNIHVIFQHFQNRTIGSYNFPSIMLLEQWVCNSSKSNGTIGVYNLPSIIVLEQWVLQQFQK